MPRHSTPTLRRHKRSGHSYARFDGRQVWFGPFEDPQTHQAFAEHLARWEANGNQAADSPVSAASLRVVDLVARYLAYAEVYYRHPDGSPTGTVEAVSYAVRPLLGLFATSLASEFTITSLKLVRERMIQDGLARKTINKRVSRIIQVFRWAAEESLASAEVFHALCVLRPLKAGRSAARETEPRRAVSRGDVDAALPFLSTPVRAMVELQWWSGMRPGEVVSLRLIDLEQDSTPWIYRPARHKTAHHGRERVIALGPRARAALEPVLLRIPPPNPGSPLFSPRDAEAERNRERRERRQTPLWASHRRHSERRRRNRPRRRLGDGYTVASYRRAVRRACERAGGTIWTPHSLRHAAATRIRSRMDLESARVALGHASASMAEHYAALDQGKAAEIMERLG